MKYTDSQIVHVKDSSEEKARLKFLSLPEFEDKSIVLTLVGQYYSLSCCSDVSTDVILEHVFVFSWVEVLPEDNQ